MAGFARVRVSRGFVTDWFRGESGFTTFGSACAILLACSMAFFCVWAGRSYSRAAGVQAAADAVALAAENEVAEFIVAVRAADAVLLSMSLTGLSLVGVGTACCCVPPVASLGKTLLETGRQVIAKRDEFARAAEKGLSGLQDALPVAAQLQAQAVLQENSEVLNACAIGYVELVPRTGSPIKIKGASLSQEAAEKAQAEGDRIAQDASAAQDAREKANEAMKRGFENDCGNAPGHCMYERADELAGMSSSDNPMYHSVNSWSFSVPLKRAKAYYRFRSLHEAPENDALEERARSALRKRFYSFASSELESGYVRDDGEHPPDLNFPQLPSDTDEMKKTKLYTEAVYPVAKGNLHAWEGCPEAAGAAAKGSISQQDEGLYGVCPTCSFSASSLGKVAAASSSIENGFEYHYRKVAQAAQEYEAAAGEATRREGKAKSAAQQAIDSVVAAIKEVAACRIEAYPPGRHGALAAIVLDAREEGPVVFVNADEDIGSFAAVSAAVLGEDAEENVLSSLLDGIVDKVGPPLSDAGPAVLSMWGAALDAYATGSQGLVEGIGSSIDSIPLLGSTGLGKWASDKLVAMIESVGLEPANTASPKPFISNSSHVAARGDGPVSRAIVAVKGGG